jgi:hypothetical protein
LALVGASSDPEVPTLVELGWFFATKLGPELDVSFARKNICLARQMFFQKN